MPFAPLTPITLPLHIKSSPGLEPPGETAAARQLMGFIVLLLGSPPHLQFPSIEDKGTEFSIYGHKMRSPFSVLQFRFVFFK